VHDIDTSDKGEQRKFGIVMAIAITVIGVIRWGLGGFAVFPTYFFAVAGVFLVLGVAVPVALQPAFFAWMKLAVVLNWIMTRVLLGLAFYVMITPARVIIAIFGDDPLKREYLPEGETYWEEAEEQPEEFDRYRNQY
jgi:hypothetical protein